MKFQGTTKKGDGRGKKIGFPTVNVEFSSLKYEEGVFAVRGELNGEKFEGIAHFGPRPTFGDARLSVEIHIFDFEDTVPAGSKIEFRRVGEKIREIRSFPSPQDLIEQIERDIDRAGTLLSVRDENDD